MTARCFVHWRPCARMNMHALVTEHKSFGHRPAAAALGTSPRSIAMYEPGSETSVPEGQKESRLYNII